MFRIRVADLDDVSEIADVHIQSWNSTYRGIVADDFIDNMSHSRSEERWSTILSDESKLSLVNVATNETDRIVGFAVGGHERNGDPNYDSELYAIYLLKGYQGQGIGRQLVSSITRGLMGRSISSMLVWALKDNHPAREFYMSLGGKAYRERIVEIGGVGYPDIAYGWSDLSSLVCR